MMWGLALVPLPSLIPLLQPRLLLKVYHLGVRIDDEADNGVGIKVDGATNGMQAHGIIRIGGMISKI